MSEINLEEKLCKNLEDSCIKAYKAGQQSMQAEIDRLNSVLDERTKEWLQAIECGTYFENVAKPLKAENDSLKTQLNNMEACYIGKKQQIHGLHTLILNWRGLKIKGIAPEHRAYEKALGDCADQLEQSMRGAND